MKKLKTILLSNIFLILLIFSFALAYFQSNQELPSFYNLADTEITGKIISLVQTEEKLSLIIKGKEKIQANYYNELPTSLELGDLVKLKGNLKLPTNNTVPNN